MMFVFCFLLTIKDRSWAIKNSPRSNILLPNNRTKQISSIKHKEDSLDQSNRVDEEGNSTNDGSLSPLASDQELGATDHGVDVMPEESGEVGFESSKHLEWNVDRITAFVEVLHDGLANGEGASEDTVKCPGKNVKNESPRGASGAEVAKCCLDLAAFCAEVLDVLEAFGDIVGVAEGTGHASAREGVAHVSVVTEADHTLVLGEDGSEVVVRTGTDEGFATGLLGALELAFEGLLQVVREFGLHIVTEPLDELGLGRERAGDAIVHEEADFIRVEAVGQDDALFAEDDVAAFFVLQFDMAEDHTDEV